MSYNNNPYNFVPLYNKVYKRYYNLYQLPSHGKIDENLYSGTINCTITAETPICVSAGKAENGPEDFVRNAAGQYVIPGSTLKGIVRTNMMILGFGAMRPGEDFNDRRMMYRVVAKSKDDVGKRLNKEYFNDLGKGSKIETFTDNDGNTVKKQITVWNNVESGYLVQSQADKVYRIYPAKYHSINRKWDFVKDEWKSGAKAFARTENVWYWTNGKGRINDLEIRTADSYDDEPEEVRSVRTGKSTPFKGVLLLTGQWISKEPNHLYVFEEFDNSADPVVLDDEDILIYKTDYEFREKSLSREIKGTNENTDPEFWKLPEVGDSGKDTEPWPVFFIKNKTNERFLGRSPLFRLGYKHTLGHGLPPEHKKAAKPLTLDYVYSILGFTYNDEEDSEKSFSYRSRVSFGDFAVSNNKYPGREVQLILQEPKPSSFKDYSENGKDYNLGDFRIRGIKQYWLLKKENPPKKEKLKNSNLVSTVKTMPPKTTFSGTIRFTNLHEDELGLLLWCLKLDDGCYQTIGKGKPYGYGRCSVKITGVDCVLPNKLYSASNFTGVVTEPQDADALIEGYKRQIESEFLMGRSVYSTLPIKDFVTIHSEIRNWSDVRYFEIDKPQQEYKKRTKPLPTIDDFRKEKQQRNKQN